MKTGLRLDTKQWDGYLKKTAADANKRLWTIVTGSVENISRIAKKTINFTVTDQSGLVSSVHPVYDKPKLTGSVEVRAEYAAFVEFGTGRKVNVPGELTAYAMQFKGKTGRIVNNIARPYLYPAFFRERVIIFEKLKNLI